MNSPRPARKKGGISKVGMIRTEPQPVFAPWALLHCFHEKMEQRDGHGKNVESTVPGGGAATAMLRAMTVAWAGLGCAALLASCFSAPVKLRCQELRLRYHHSDLSLDEKRFAWRELRDCEEKAEAAKARESRFFGKVDSALAPPVSRAAGRGSSGPDTGLADDGYEGSLVEEP